YDPTRPWRHFVEFVQPETSDPKGDASSRLNSFYNVFHGKGSVAEIRFVLQLQAWKHRPDAAGKRAWKDSTTAQIALQEFCDQKIGLDCNGFVTNCANYINKLKLLPSVVASTSTLAFTKKAHLRPSTDKVKAYDVISYLQAGDVVDQNISQVCMIDQVLTQDTEQASNTR